MTYFTGPLEVGTAASSDSTAGKARAVLTQTVLVNFSAAGTANVDATLTLPANSQIIEIYADTLTAWDSGTSASLTVGSTAGGTEYFTGVDVKTNGREAASNSAAQLAAMDDIGTNTTVYVRVAQTGATSAGQARVTLTYA